MMFDKVKKWDDLLFLFPFRVFVFSRRINPATRKGPDYQWERVGGEDRKFSQGREPILGARGYSTCRYRAFFFFCIALGMTRRIAAF